MIKLDKDSIEAIAGEIVGNAMAEYWWFWFMIVFISAFVSFFSAYLKERGRYRALEEKFDEVLIQTTEIQRATRKVDTEFDKKLWFEKEEGKLWRQKLEEFTSDIDDICHGTMRYYNLAVNGQPPMPDFVRLKKVMIKQTLYLSEFEEWMLMFRDSFLKVSNLCIDIQSNWKEHPQSMEDHEEFINWAKSEFDAAYSELAMQMDMLIALVKKEIERFKLI